MSGREQEFIKEAFDTNWVVPLGPNVNAFEKSLKDFLIEHEDRCVVALSAGTAASVSYTHLDVYKRQLYIKV